MITLRIILIVVAAAAACRGVLHAQSTGGVAAPCTPSDTLRAGHHTPAAPPPTTTPPEAPPWYDTLQVTQPRFVATRGPIETAELAAFIAVSIPTSLAIIATSVLPPSISVLRESGINHTGIALSTGFSFVHDTTAVIFFPDYRIQVEGGYYIGRKPSMIVRASVNVDRPIASLSHRDIFWFGVAGGAGIASDVASTGPYVEGWVGVLNPMGIRYIGLYPMHHLGLRGRIGYDPVTRAPWYELAVAFTSTFWF